MCTITMKATNNLTFKMTRQKPELIPPSKHTPHEFKTLSDIDNQEGLRMQVPLLHFYRKDPTMGTKDPVKVIRDAIAKALVYYYPFAGRLREGRHARKLVVECNREGIMFIEADADVTLKEFGDTLYPPFPCLEELLYDVPGSAGMLNCPLLLIQVTRLKCGGFIFALRFNHTMTDGTGISQFMFAVSEIARGAETPSVQPVWERHLLDAQEPPSATCTHDVLRDTKGSFIPLDDMVHRSFVLGKTEISTLRRNLPPRLQSCSTFELLTAFLWRCRTIAISPNPDEEAILISVVDARKRFNPPLPTGYYGNALAFPAAISKSEDIRKKPLGHALDLVKKMKYSLTDEYMKSLVNQTAMSSRPVFNGMQSYMVSDVTQLRLVEVDFGWGKPVYAGPAKGGVGMIPGGASWYILFKNNNKGENEIVVPVCLPADAMEMFVKELDTTLKKARKSAL